MAQAAGHGLRLWQSWTRALQMKDWALGHGNTSREADAPLTGTWEGQWGEGRGGCVGVTRPQGSVIRV